MFWTAYRVVDLAETDDDRRALFSKAFWHNDPLPTFTHVETGLLDERGFAGGVFPSPKQPFPATDDPHPEDSYHGGCIFPASKLARVHVAQ